MERKPTNFTPAVKISRAAVKDHVTQDPEFQQFLQERLPTLVETILAEVLELKNQLEGMNRGPGTPK